MSNDLVSTFNYGNTKYISYSYIEKWEDNRKMENCNMMSKLNKQCTQYFIAINASKINYFISTHIDIFKRFIEEKHLIIKHNKIHNTYYKVFYYEINKSFLSYMLQNKKQLEENIYEIDGYSIYNVGQTPNMIKTFNTSKKKQYKVEDGNYTLIKAFIQNKKQVKQQFKVKVSNNIITSEEEYDKGEEYIIDIKTGKLQHKTKQKENNYNYYDIFIENLKVFFKGVNNNNESDFDKYLDNEVGKYMRTDSNKCINDLNEAYEQKRKKILEGK